MSTTPSEESTTPNEEPTVGRRRLLRMSVGAAAAGGAGAAGAGTVAADPYEGFLEDVENYEGTRDLRGQEEIRIDVGAGEDGLLFDPPAILVDPGTTVVWEWTGEGGGHTVTASEGPANLDSDLTDEAGHTYEFTFEQEGITKYVCMPHENLGMKAAVAAGVEEQVADDLLGTDDVDGAGDAGGTPLEGVDFLTIAFALGLVAVLLVAPFYGLREES